MRFTSGPPKEILQRGCCVPSIGPAERQHHAMINGLEQVANKARNVKTFDYMQSRNSDSRYNW